MSVLFPWGRGPRLCSAKCTVRIDAPAGASVTWRCGLHLGHPGPHQTQTGAVVSTWPKTLREYA